MALQTYTSHDIEQSILGDFDMDMLRDSFVVLDADGDGLIDIGSLSAAARRGLGVERYAVYEPYLYRIFDAADKDRDGFLSLREYIECFAEGPGILPQEIISECVKDVQVRMNNDEVFVLQKCFFRLDMNKDGLLDQHDILIGLQHALRSAYPAMSLVEYKDLAADIISKADLDGDGKLNLSEFIRSFQEDKKVFPLEIIEHKPVDILESISKSERMQLELALRSFISSPNSSPAPIGDIYAKLLTCIQVAFADVLENCDFDAIADILIENVVFLEDGFVDVRPSLSRFLSENAGDPDIDGTVHTHQKYIDDVIPSGETTELSGDMISKIEIAFRFLSRSCSDDGFEVIRLMDVFEYLSRFIRDQFVDLSENQVAVTAGRIWRHHTTSSRELTLSQLLKTYERNELIVISGEEFPNPIHVRNFGALPICEAERIANNVIVDISPKNRQILLQAFESAGIDTTEIKSIVTFADIKRAIETSHPECSDLIVCLQQELGQGPHTIEEVFRVARLQPIEHAVSKATDLPICFSMFELAIIEDVLKKLLPLITVEKEYLRKVLAEFGASGINIDAFLSSCSPWIDSQGRVVIHSVAEAFQKSPLSLKVQETISDINDDLSFIESTLGFEATRAITEYLVRADSEKTGNIPFSAVLTHMRAIVMSSHPSWSSENVSVVIKVLMNRGRTKDDSVSFSELICDLSGRYLIVPRKYLDPQNGALTRRLDKGDLVKIRDSIKSVALLPTEEQKESLQRLIVSEKVVGDISSVNAIVNTVLQHARSRRISFQQIVDNLECKPNLLSFPILSQHECDEVCVNKLVVSIPLRIIRIICMSFVLLDHRGNGVLRSIDIESDLRRRLSAHVSIQELDNIIRLISLSLFQRNEDKLRGFLDTPQTTELLASGFIEALLKVPGAILAPHNLPTINMKFSSTLGFDEVERCSTLFNGVVEDHKTSLLKSDVVGIVDLALGSGRVKEKSSLIDLLLTLAHPAENGHFNIFSICKNTTFSFEKATFKLKSIDPAEAMDLSHRIVPRPEKLREVARLFSKLDDDKDDHLKYSDIHPLMLADVLSFSSNRALADQICHARFHELELSASGLLSFEAFVSSFCTGCFPVVSDKTVRRYLNGSLKEAGKVDCVQLCATPHHTKFSCPRKFADVPVFGEELQEEFNKLDCQEDGTIRYEELKKYYRSLEFFGRRPDEREIESLFRTVCSGNESVTFEEFCIIMLKRSKM